MRTLLRVSFSLCALATAAACARADSLALRNGTIVSGSWVSIDATEINFMVDGHLQAFARAEVAKVVFGNDPAPSGSSAPASSKPENERHDPPDSSSR